MFAAEQAAGFTGPTVGNLSLWGGFFFGFQSLAFAGFDNKARGRITA
jgi:hypothetical protein